MVTLGFGRCELVSEDVPSSRLLGAARLWVSCLVGGIVRGVGVECKLACGSVAVGGGLGVIQVEYRRKAVPHTALG